MPIWSAENLDTIIVALLGTTGWLGFIVNKLGSRKESRQQTIKQLREQNEQLTKKLAQFENIQASEKTIDKSKGTIYLELLVNGKSRPICGYCWENEHKKLPVVPRIEQDEWWAHCSNCGKYCTYYNEEIVPSAKEDDDDGELPF